MTRTVAYFSILTAALAAGAAPPADDSTDAQLLEKLLGEDAAPAASDTPDARAKDKAPANEKQSADAEPAAPGAGIDPSVLEDISMNLREAQRLLAEKQTGKPTQAAQQKAIDDLNRLIEAVKQQANQSKSSGRQQSSSRDSTKQEKPQDASTAERRASSEPSGGEPSGAPLRNRNGKAEESSDRLPESRPAGNRIGERRAGLVREAWGHLPQRLREQLLNAGSDRTLPQYDSMIRSYFESLATPDGSPAAPR